MDSLSREKFTLLSVTLWATWTSRGKAIDESMFQTPRAMKEFIVRFMADLGTASLPGKVSLVAVTSSNAPVPRPKAPPASYAKIHVDTAVRFQRGGAAAAICRDSQGVYLGSSSLVIAGVCDPSTLEAIACREAIALAEDLNVQQFVVASDCKQVIGDIARDSQGPYGAIIREIKLRSSPLLCNFTFKSRAVNLEAHKLAKFSLCLPPGRHVWLGQPHDQRYGGIVV